jgi:hypothetical protein
VRARSTAIAATALVGLAVAAAPALARVPTTISVDDATCDPGSCIIWGTIDSAKSACLKARKIDFYAVRPSGTKHLDSVRTNGDGNWAVKQYADDVPGDATGYRMTAARSKVGPPHHRTVCAAGHKGFKL